VSGREVPVFPLGSVLLPGQLLPLHVFEPRYRVMMFDLRDADPAEFAVVLIERGHEVGGGEVRSDVGCLARVLQSEELTDGRHLVVSVGTDRVRVVVEPLLHPHPRALLAVDPDEPWPDAADDLGRLQELTAAARRLGVLAAELGAPPWPPELRLDDDPAGRLWQLALLTPLGTLDRQRLLANRSPAARMEALSAMVQEQQELLEARLRWGDGPPPGA
jgi:Lon protease-like protein